MIISNVLSQPKALTQSLITVKKVYDYELDDDAGFGIDDLCDIYFAPKDAKFWQTNYEDGDFDGLNKIHLHYYRLYNKHQLYKIISKKTHQKHNSIEPYYDLDELKHASDNDVFIYNDEVNNSVDMQEVGKVIRRHQN